ncbi:titin homolog isoform X2 [Toxorhynchites rutilus septentrionalis]|uniref:titin homolog isoform X2 n=1 Tax=Toxorhynchites rutilus septentrionalis TaxID=329112 RepID=UPI00247A12FE|nr:titin homolog isoform X2 [Toxorhynchites rutilus septentrionalis]
MSHRNNDNNSPWNNRNSRNNNDSGIGVGGEGSGYKGWSGNSRYNADNRYNKDRRNYRGGYGGRNDRRGYDDRRGGKPYRSGPWSGGNNGPIGPDGNYSSHARYHYNRHQKNSDKTISKYGPANDNAQANPRPILQDNVQQIAPSTVNFTEPANEDLAGPATVATNGGRERKPEVVKSTDTVDSAKTWAAGDYASPGEEFQGFPDTESSKTANGDAVDTREDDKADITPQENELIKLIEDEAFKMMTDADQPSCSTSSQNNNSENSVTATNVAEPNQNPERRMTIERSAEQVTRKLINQLTTMNKYSLKQMINNPDSKYETALKTHARQKLRAEVRRQLRNFSLSESTAQVKTNCGMLEPDECVDSDKIPDALLEQIGKVLDLNLLDLNVPEEQAPANHIDDEDECVINQPDTDYSATEVLDKNLRLTDDDDVQLHLDAEDIFARAELLLMKGSESVRKGNSSGPSSPTEEMFPNDQIDSIVSEENGFDKGLELTGSDSPKEADLLAESLATPAFPCFLRVSTVEELNKKVDDLSSITVDNNQDECIDNNTKESIEPPSIEIEDTCASNSGNLSSVLDVPNITIDFPEQTGVLNEKVAENVDETVQKQPASECSEKSVAQTETIVGNPSCGLTVTDTEMTPAESKIQEEIATKKPEPPTGTIRAPTHPELAARKSKGSKAYKPNLVMHEHNKRDAKSISSSPSRSSSQSNIGSLTTAKSHKPGSNLPALKQTTTCPAKHHNTNNSNSSSNNSNNVNIVNNSNNHSREKSQRKRDFNVKEPSIGSSSNVNSVNVNAVQTNSNSRTSDSPSRAGNKGSSLPREIVQPSPSKETSPPGVPATKTHPARAQTPGPKHVPELRLSSSSFGKKKKKKKRNRRKDHSPDGGMMLECDLRISRPAVTPTPPPVQPRDVNPNNGKRTNEFEREPKPTRETRAKSVDPKLCYDAKRDREKDRSRDKSRVREIDDKKDTERESKKEKNKDDKKEADKEKEIKKEKENDKTKEREERKEKETSANAETTTKNGNHQAELCLPKTDRERKKSPAPKVMSRAAMDSPKHSRDGKEPPKEPLPSDVVQEHETVQVKEVPRETSKENEPVVVSEDTETSNVLKEEENRDTLSEEQTLMVPKNEEIREVSRERETRGYTKDKCTKDDVNKKGSKEPPGEKEMQNGSKEREAKVIAKDKEVKEKEPTESAPEIEVERTQKKKKSLLRGPNLIKGRKEVVSQEAAASEEPPAQRSRKETVPQEIQTGITKLRQETVPAEPPICTVQSLPQRREVAVAVTSQSAISDHSTFNLNTASCLVSRTASPRPWKSPGEKKLLPAVPLLPAPAQTVPPLSPNSEGQCTPTHPSPVTSPEPQYVRPATSAMISSQPDVLQRITLPSTLAPLAAPQASAFAPVMALLNQMQDIDNKMSDLQRRKMQIDSEMMKLNSEKFQIDQSSMQLQSDRFMVLNALRAALVDCELSTIAAVQSMPRMAPSNSMMATRRRPLEPQPEIVPKSKRRKEAEPILKSPPPVQKINAASASAHELSEPEEPATPSSTAGTGGERTITRITKISDNTQILKLFQRRRLISDKSAEESQSEDSAGPVVGKPTTTKRRRTRTTTAEQNDAPLPTVGGRLRSNSNRSVEARKSVESTSQSASLDQTASSASIPTTVSSPNFPTTLPGRVMKKDEEVPLVGHRNLLTREVKIVLSKLNVADRSNT